ncbi:MULTISPECIES: hypothetical protein [Streptomyces]|uniref:Uncharacterized protein n=1 Tax=Streptomyces spororaveus TaxID=284039 RepID=A0ABQ3TMI8_9ACTN|nr:MULTISPECIES: hypothetical protein [Streptomyces]MCM9078067.1 hypothetical protein [Streptomyces spororaveus]MCX5307518.1 hypothetical protein [Streptomyces sp. NBC_00160]GHI81631.1 hypothetical protein Sspor_71920 [Streptomyces spororaveus]
MAGKQGRKKNVSPGAVTARANLERAVADVDRVLGLQELRAGQGGGAAIAGFHSTQSVGCSTYSVACGPHATVEM